MASRFPDQTNVTTASNRDFWFRCPDAKQCGGCQLTTMPYKAQLRHKQAYMDSLFSDICAVQPIIGMENPFHYRNKVHAVFGTDKSGNPIAGIYQQGTHHLVPVRHCLLENELAGKIIQHITSLFKTFRWRIYNEYTHRGLIRHAVVRVSESTRQIMVTLVTTTFELPHLEQFVEAVLEVFPQITTIVLNQNTRVTSAVLGTKEKVLYGPGYIEDILLGKRFRISSRSFYQVNSRQTQVLYKTAIDSCNFQGTEVLLDAYCGTGTIGLCAADSVRRLIGIEINKDAVLDARLNAKTNGIDHASFLTGDAGTLLQNLVREHTLPDTVIMDPPRSGSSSSFLQTLLQVLPPHILYISCNPETLLRDLQVLIPKYTVQSIVPVDMFPGTQHVETVCCLYHQKKDFIYVSYEPKNAE